MTEIQIPFLPEFEDTLKYGQKCMTTRTKRYGEVGDTFTAFETHFKIQAIFKIRLWRIAHQFYHAEGFGTSQEFIKVWDRLHRNGYETQEQLHFWVHIFTPDYEEARA